MPWRGIRRARGAQRAQADRGAKYDAAMGDRRYALFDTAIGTCALAWSAHGIAGVQLPEPDARSTESRLLRRFPNAVEAAPEGAARRAIDGIVTLLDGAAVDFADIVLDQSGLGPFERSVYAVTRTIGAGSTLSYGEVAARIGEPGNARAVGQALGRNPFAIIVPCHRVLAAGGRIGGFSAGGGAMTKGRILAIERARVGEAPDLFSGAGSGSTPRPA
jgi:methylated-DNA-[protein]-cysteine S-methyltransferase